MPKDLFFSSPVLGEPRALEMPTAPSYMEVPPFLRQDLAVLLCSPGYFHKTLYILASCLLGLQVCLYTLLICFFFKQLKLSLSTLLASACNAVDFCFP